MVGGVSYSSISPRDMPSNSPMFAPPSIPIISVPCYCCCCCCCCGCGCCWGCACCWGWGDCSSRFWGGCGCGLFLGLFSVSMRLVLDWLSWDEAPPNIAARFPIFMFAPPSMLMMLGGAWGGCGGGVGPWLLLLFSGCFWGEGGVGATLLLLVLPIYSFFCSWGLFSSVVLGGCGGGEG